MRLDKQYPYRRYENFLDWLNVHPIWMLLLVFGILQYYSTTEEI